MTYSLPPLPRNGQDFKIHTIQELRQKNGDDKSSINEAIRLTQESTTIVRGTSTIVQGASKQLAQLEESQRDLRFEVKNTADQIQHTCSQTKELNLKIQNIHQQIRETLDSSDETQEQKDIQLINSSQMCDFHSREDLKKMCCIAITLTGVCYAGFYLWKKYS